MQDFFKRQLAAHHRMIQWDGIWIDSERPKTSCGGRVGVWVGTDRGLSFTMTPLLCLLPSVPTLFSGRDQQLLHG